MKNMLALTLAFVLAHNITAQSDTDRLLKGGELILSGLTILKSAKADAPKDVRIIDIICVKNKLGSTITFRLRHKEVDHDMVKELVVPKDAKECLFQLPKGIYTYEIILSNKEICRKGEYNFDQEITMVIKDD